jgi:hypothetical protein
MAEHSNGRVGHFHIPGRATVRDYAVYVMVARRRQTGDALLYVGKTGDNKEGCNPVISRAGNHFSFNKIHSQMRNKLPAHPEEYDFDFFYTTFGCYVDPKLSRAGIDAINEMERQLNKMAQALPRALLNPLAGTAKPSKAKRLQRQALATEERLAQLAELVEVVRRHLAETMTASARVEVVEDRGG